MDRSLLVAALLRVLVQVAYFAYGAAGITQQLWNDGRGFFFSANDVLHVGMIGWLAYVFAIVGKHLCDYEPRSNAVAPGSRQGLEQLGQVPEHPVLERAARPPQDEQPRRVPRLGGAHGDGARRKVVVVVAGVVHERGYASCG